MFASTVPAINVPHGDIAVDAQPYFPEPLRDPCLSINIIRLNHSNAAPIQPCHQNPEKLSWINLNDRVRGSTLSRCRHLYYSFSPSQVCIPAAKLRLIAIIRYIQLFEIDRGWQSVRSKPTVP